MYYDDMIRDYEGVWNNNDQLATWVRMLAAADPVWPTPPELPRSVKPSVLARLKESSLIETLPAHRYRIKGFDLEREARSNAGRNAAAVRWQSKGNANAMPTPTPVPSQTKPIERESLAGYDGRADLEAFVLARGRAPTPKQRRYLDSVLAVHDITGPQWAADLILGHPDDPIGAVMEADRHWRHERLEEARNQERKAQKPQRSRGLTGANAELAELMRDADAKRGVA